MYSVYFFSSSLAKIIIAVSFYSYVTVLINICCYQSRMAARVNGAMILIFLIWGVQLYNLSFDFHPVFSNIIVRKNWRYFLSRPIIGTRNTGLRRSALRGGHSKEI